MKEIEANAVVIIKMLTCMLVAVVIANTTAMNTLPLFGFLTPPLWLILFYVVHYAGREILYVLIFLTLVLLSTVVLVNT